MYVCACMHMCLGVYTYVRVYVHVHVHVHVCCVLQHWYYGKYNDKAKCM